MPWQSKWTAQFTKPVIAQILAIINRDIAAALADVNAAAGYQPFAEYDLAEVPIVNFPAILLLPESQTFDPEQQQLRSYAVRLLLSIAVAHQDPNQVAGILEDYIRAVDEALSAAWWLTNSDFTSSTIPLPSPPYAAGAMSPGLINGALKSLFIEGHAYDELRRTSNALFAKSATMSIALELRES